MTTRADMVRAGLWTVGIYLVLVAGAIVGGAALAALFLWMGVRVSL